jgi:hypothetical protein
MLNLENRYQNIRIKRLQQNISCIIYKNDLLVFLKNYERQEQNQMVGFLWLMHGQHALFSH